MRAYATRRHYFVSYDISDDARRLLVFRTLKDFGNHVQYSVFFCQLTPREVVELRDILGRAINHAEDQVLIVDLGLAVHPLEDCLEAIGQPYTSPARHFVV